MFLLHGDLHHGNILHNGAHWVAIDQKVSLAPPMHEVWEFFMDAAHIYRPIFWLSCSGFARLVLCTSGVDGLLEFRGQQGSKPVPSSCHKILCPCFLMGTGDSL